MSADMTFVQRGGKNDWRTPVEEIIEPLEEHVGIDLDPCPGVATAEMGPTDHATVNYYPPEHNGILDTWDVRDHPDVDDDGGVTAFVNMPFAKKQLWLRKGIAEWRIGNVDRVVFLTPANTDAEKWWHRYICNYSPWNWFAVSRVDYIDPKTGNKRGGVPFNSALSIIGGVPRSLEEAWAFDDGDVVYRPRAHADLRPDGDWP